jgi:hypothetical protein
MIAPREQNATVREENAVLQAQNVSLRGEVTVFQAQLSRAPSASPLSTRRCVKWSIDELWQWLAQRPYANDLRKEHFVLIDGLLEQNVPAFVGCVDQHLPLWEKDYTLFRNYSLNKLFNVTFKFFKSIHASAVSFNHVG